MQSTGKEQKITLVSRIGSFVNQELNRMKSSYLPAGSKRITCRIMETQNFRKQ